MVTGILRICLRVGVRRDSERADGQLATHVRVGTPWGAGVAGVCGEKGAPTRCTYRAAAVAVRALRSHCAQPARIAQQRPPGQQGDETFISLKQWFDIRYLVDFEELL